MSNNEIRTKTRTKKTPFGRWNTYNRLERTDENTKDVEKIKRYGKYLTLQEFLKENAKECTIYDVLQTYRGDMKLTQEKLNIHTHKIIDDLAGIEDLRSALDIMKTAQNSWKTLPLEIRKEFGNNIDEFQKNGVKWAKTQLENIKNQKQQEQKVTEKGDTNNA